jgi:hypothetical protein
MSDTSDVRGPAAPETEVASRSSLVVLIVLMVVFAILYAYPLFQGISNFVALPPYYRQLGIGGAVPWYLLVIGVLAPPALYLGALLLGRSREIFARALILAVGLAATNAIALSVVQWAQAVQPAIK